MELDPKVRLPVHNGVQSNEIADRIANEIDG